MSIYNKRGTMAITDNGSHRHRQISVAIRQIMATVRAIDQIHPDYGRGVWIGWKWAHSGRLGYSIHTQQVPASNGQSVVSEILSVTKGCFSGSVGNQVARLADRYQPRFDPGGTISGAYVMRLIFQAGKEGLPLYSLICER